MSMSKLPAVEIDLNDRVDGRYTPVRLSDMPLGAVVGMKVQVFEPEDEISSTATVVGVRRRFVLLDVAWSDFEDADVVELRARADKAATSAQKRATASQHLVSARIGHRQSTSALGLYGALQRNGSYGVASRGVVVRPAAKL